jgi:excisionase family DNA binding protein
MAALVSKRKDAADRVLEVDASMSGTLTFKDAVNLRINGNFEGNLQSKGNLTIGEEGMVEAQIVGDNIVIAGKVKGNIFAKDRLELRPTALLEGDIQAPRLIIQEGAVFIGHCRMLEDVLNAEDLSRYLEVDKNSVLEWANSGKVPAFKEGEEWRFERKKIDEWLLKNAVK